MKEGGGEGKEGNLSFPPPPRSFTCATFLAVSLSLVPRSFLLNQTEKLATQASVRINPGSTVSVFKYMTFFLNVSERFLFVADSSEQSSASRSKEQLPSPSGTKFIAPVHTNPDMS